MYDSANYQADLPEKTTTDYISKALLSTLDEYPHFTLNQQALISLDIIPPLKSNGLPVPTKSSSRSNSTIFEVLNKCRTLSGQRLLLQWLQNPLTSKEHIDRRLDIVKYLVKNQHLLSLCHDDFLRRIPDLLKIASKIAKEKCTILDLVKIYNVCKLAQNLCKNYHHVVSITDHPPCESLEKMFNWMKSSCSNLDDFMQLLDDSLILDRPDENNDYLLKPKFNDDIAKITQELDTLISKAKAELRYVADDVCLEANKSIKLEIDAEKGFDMRVTKQNEQSIRGNSNYIQSSLVKKDGFRFTTKLLSKLSNNYIQAKSEYNSVAKGVYDEIISKAVMYDEQVLELCMSFTVLDVFVSYSIVARDNDYISPLILDMGAGKIEIEKLRHPCVENQPDIDKYVPNDIFMNKDEKKFYIVTGPNMGGKSTYIKSIAVGVIMAQCGSLIPAEDGKISIIDDVYTRIGAGDRQTEGVSTFMEEMTDMQYILSQASENSLVIIDELGRGTSTFDGYGIAYAISHHLAVQVKCYGIFATHFHELTEMEEEVQTVGNLHVKAYCYGDKLTMLYNVCQGSCDESYGINVARFTKFPEHVVQCAEKKLKQFEEVPGFANKQEVRDFVREFIKENPNLSV